MPSAKCLAGSSGGGTRREGKRTPEQQTLESSCRCSLSAPSLVRAPRDLQQRSGNPTRAGWRGCPGHAHVLDGVVDAGHEGVLEGHAPPGGREVRAAVRHQRLHWVHPRTAGLVRMSGEITLSGELASMPLSLTPTAILSPVPSCPLLQADFTGTPSLQNIPLCTPEQIFTA